MLRAVFAGAGGSYVHAKLMLPKNRQRKCPAVCLFHGYSGAFTLFSNLMNCACAGFAAAAMDCRGQVGLSEDRGSVLGTTLRGHIVRGLGAPDSERLYYRNVFLDTAQMACIVMSMDEVDEGRVGALGFSQGGGLMLACAALTPQLNRAATICPFLWDYRCVWEMDLDVRAYDELREYFRHFDPLHEHEAEIFTRLDYIDNQHLAHRIRAETMMVTCLMDTVCPPSTQYAAYNKITMLKRHVAYPDYAHEQGIYSSDMVMQFMLGMQAGA